MATRPKTKKIVEPSPSAARETQTKFKHPWRIVPLQTAPRLGAAITPELTYRNGPLLTNVEVFTVFWGAAWQDSTNSAVAKQMNEFFDFILTSKLIDQLAEYNVEGKTIEHGKRTGSLTLTTSEPGTQLQDRAIQKMLQEEIAAGTLPKNNANSLYFVFLPPGTQVELAGAASCSDFCGYHDATSDNVFYATMPYANCTGCEGELAMLDARTGAPPDQSCLRRERPAAQDHFCDAVRAEEGMAEVAAGD